MAVDPMMTQENPQETPVERYTILREVGRGAIGTVYAARDRFTGAVVALKTLDPALFSEPNSKLAELFLENARSAARLRHRNIVRIFDAGELGGTAYVAMELVEGESLRHMLDDRPLSIARVIQIFDDVASALAYAHEEGMVHRGVKPSNILVLRSGVAKIGDFGTGQIGEAALRYMSPEQVRRDPVDHRSDLFSLGAVLYEMLTRRASFEGDSPEQISENILRAKPPRPSEVNPHVPGALDGMVLRMLAGHPEDRFADARILLRDLQRIEEALGLRPGASAGESTAASAPPRGSEPAPRTPGRPEPGLRMPEPNRFRDRGPMQEAPRFAQHDQTRDASGLGFRPAPSAVEGFQERSRIPGAEAFYEQDARFMNDRVREPERSSGSRTAIFTTLALVLAVLSMGLTFFLHYSPDAIERLTLASRTQEAPATATAPAPSTALPRETAAAPSPSTTPPPATGAKQEPATAPAARKASPPRAVGDARVAVSGARPEEPSAIASAPDPLPPQPLVEEPSPSTQTDSLPTREPEQSESLPTRQPEQTESLAARASEQSATGATAPPQEAPPPTANIPQSQPRGTAKLNIAVSPQGEIYVDGEHYGTTPPITTLDLEPGMHRIEIRNGSRKPYLTYMTVEAGDQRRIRHDFSAKPSGPPR
jgi:serine/threonine protein kinase